MKRALCLIPDGPNYRRHEFVRGLDAAGYEVVRELRGTPRPDELLVIWNRGSWRDAEARRFEAAGARVVVCENGYFGKNWLGRKWFAMALGHHAGAGSWPNGGPERWDSWGAPLAPWREGGREVIVLEQRSIGEPGVASPRGWERDVARRVGGRVRNHPGAGLVGLPLAEDLQDARCVVTWSSGGAILALLMGVPVFYAFPQWIGGSAARHLSEFALGPVHGDRLDMFRRLAWAMWTADEVSSGVPFERLASCAS